jgi:hypothetical protein
MLPGNGDVSKFKLQIGNHILMQPLNTYTVGQALTVVDASGKWVEVKIKEHVKFSRYICRRLLVSDDVMMRFLVWWACFI